LEFEEAPQEDRNAEEDANDFKLVPKWSENVFEFTTRKLSRLLPTSFLINTTH
jgi:hypothetical protein